MAAKHVLKGRVALITGGAKGIGSASVSLFCEEGAKVVFIDRDGAAGSELQTKLRSERGFDVHFIKADLSQADEVARAIKTAFEIAPKFDILFNHAGTIIVKPFLETTIEEWHSMFADNATSVFLVTRLVLPHMLQQGHGVIVNTSTVGARVSTPLESVYGASKAAMHQLVRTIAVEYRDRGIRCNCICPSFVRTQHGVHEIQQLRDYGIFASEGDIKLMQGRICEPEEVAQLALFLASDASSFLNGAEIFVDNTFTAV
jgi:NAD(P)-dependent dehydrogenase (short-subunit alcohol dehydrogenase family)